MNKEDVKKMRYHPLQEDIVNVLTNKTQNPDKEFFRLQIAFYFAQLASSMRCSVSTRDRGVIPINLYVVNLAKSGYGKGFSTNIIVDKVVNKFRDTFVNSTFPRVVAESLEDIAEQRAIRVDSDSEIELDNVKAEFESLGKPVFSFDSGTIPAIKQFRQMLIMARVGAITLVADEIGSNITELAEPLKVFFELYDKGEVGDKLTKNNKDNIRVTQVFGKTPANMLLFGTPLKLFDGGTQEKEFRSLVTTGYARRCFFGHGRNTKKTFERTAEQIYDDLTNSDSNNTLIQVSKDLEELANVEFFNNVINVPKEVSILLIRYKTWCEKRAQLLPSIKEDESTQLSHAYFKVLKLAGAYAFIDKEEEVTVKHIEAAIKMAEDSTKVFSKKICHVERNHVRLTKYLADSPVPVTHADILKDLPFYPTSIAGRREILELAASWGYSENIILKLTKDNDIDLFIGERLKVTDLDEMTLAYSEKITTDYRNELVKFDDLPALLQANGYHWVTHHLKGGYRDEDHVKKGFNMVVIDVDKYVDISTVELLLCDFMYYIYTTKRHKAKKNRFRIVMPLTHRLNMDANTFKLFMKNIFDWLPFEVDDATPQRARKWLSHKGILIHNKGDLLDAQNFIPKTPKAQRVSQRIVEMSNLDTMERWFASRMVNGNRSSTLIRYALMMVDMNMSSTHIQQKVLELNSKMKDSIETSEIFKTVMVTVAKRIAAREQEDEAY